MRQRHFKPNNNRTDGREGFALGATKGVEPKLIKLKLTRTEPEEKGVSVRSNLKLGSSVASCGRVDNFANFHCLLCTMQGYPQRNKMFRF